MTNDNNFVLIIVIAIVLFWIFNINTKTNKSVEKFGKIESPLLSTNSTSSNTSVQDLLVRPPSNLSPKPTGLVSTGTATQPMYANLTSAPDKSVSSLSNANDSYMLLSSNNVPDEKFNKVLPKEGVRPVLTSGDLLPKDENKDWFQVPNSKFNLMQAVDLEVPEIKIGVDTVGQSRKNATYDLRAAPPNPKFVVSPWSNSTIEPDYNTKPLC